MTTVDWDIKGRYAVSDCGYTISFLAGAGGDGWVYMAWSPDSPDWRHGIKERYQLGECVPRKNKCLGARNDADQAKALCEDHWRKANGKAA